MEKAILSPFNGLGIPVAKKSIGHGLFLFQLAVCLCLYQDHNNVCNFEGKELQICSFAILFWLFGVLCNSLGIGGSGLPTLEKKNHFDFEGDCIGSMDQSSIAILLISIGILVVINNSNSLSLFRSFVVLLGNVSYFSIYKFCVPLIKYISVYLIVFVVSLTDCLNFLYIGPMLSVNRKSLNSFRLGCFLFCLVFLT